MRQKVLIGTSGWNYPSWRGVFYPPDLPSSRWLEFYAGIFSTLEANATFYRSPRPSTFEAWKTRTPQNFLWAVKAHRVITHIKRLKDVGEPLARFFDSLLPLEEKLGPILFQLPPRLPFHGDQFAEFCDLLKPDYRYTLEVRHPSWLTDRLFSLLKDHGIAFCISDTAGRYPYHEAVTADFVYIRLHGSTMLYASDYGEEELQEWACKIRKWKRDTFVYFDNTMSANAPKNALRLKEILGAG